MSASSRRKRKKKNFRRVERRYGSFTRSFTLPSTVSTEDVSADYSNGVLKVRLGKRAEAKPKQIKVNIRRQSPGGQEGPGSVSHRTEVRLRWTRKRRKGGGAKIPLPFVCDLVVGHRNKIVALSVLG